MKKQGTPSPPLAVRNGFVNHFAGTTVTNGLITFCGLTTGVLTARLLGPEGRGEYSIIQMYGTLAGAVCASGLSAAIIYLGNLNRGRMPKILNSTFIAGMAFSLFAGTLACGAVWAALLDQPDRVRVMAFVYLLYIPLVICTSLFWASLQAGMEIRLWNRARLLFTSLWLLPLIAFWLFLPIRADRLALIYLCFVGISVGCFFFLLLRRYGGGLFVFDKGTVIQVTRLAVPTSLSTVASHSTLRLDLILISALRPPWDMGVYVVALSFAGILSSILSSLLQLTLPKLSSVHDEAKRRELFALLCRVAACGSIVMAGLLYLVSPLVVPLLFGKEFTEAIHLGLLLLATASIVFINAMLADCLRAFGLSKQPLLAEVSGSIAVAIMLWPMNAYYGLSGIALTTVLGAFVSALCLSVFVYRRLEIPYLDLFIIRQADISFVLTQIRSLLDSYKK